MELQRNSILFTNTARGCRDFAAHFLVHLSAIEGTVAAGTHVKSNLRAGGKRAQFLLHLF